VHLTVKHLTSIAGLATALMLVASQANAQTATFTLPFQAHVGNTTLVPGEYQLRVSANGTVVPSAYLYSDGKLVATLSVLRQWTQEANGSYVELLAIGSSRYLSKFVSKDAGAVYTFGIPSAARHQILAEARASRVPANQPASN
jgi:hypothetical protein